MVYLHLSSTSQSAVKVSREGCVCELPLRGVPRRSGRLLSLALLWHREAPQCPHHDAVSYWGLLTRLSSGSGQHLVERSCQEEESESGQNCAWTHLGAHLLTELCCASFAPAGLVPGAAGDACLSSAGPASDEAVHVPRSSPLCCLSSSPGSACSLQTVTKTGC